MIRRPPRSTRTDTLFPYTTLFRSHLQCVARGGVGLLITEVTERAPFDGYTDQKSTDAKLLRNVFKAGDCWFNTGDLVRDQGYAHIQFVDRVGDTFRSEEHTSELQSLMSISYAVFCLKTKKQ